MKNLLFSLCFISILMSCNDTSQKQVTNEVKKEVPLDYRNVEYKTFDQLFEQVDSKEFKKELYQLAAVEDHTVITAGAEAHYNSMMANWEVLARYFEQPKIMNMLGANRYTLEFMKDRQTYTLSFFDKQFTSEVMVFGQKSGRNSEKMKNSKLTHVTTPSGNITYKEAKVVVECSLFEITTLNPNDFYTADGKKFVEDALKDAKDYHKLVFGTVTNVWVRK